MKHVFAMRLSLGDPSFVNTSRCIDAMLSDKYMQGTEIHALMHSACLLPLRSVLYRLEL